MTQSSKLRLVAAALSIAAVALTAPAAWAFSTENLTVNQNGNSRFADPDSQVKNGQNALGPNGPIVHFGPSSSSRGVGPNSNYPPPSPYAMPPGPGN